MTFGEAEAERANTKKIFVSWSPFGSNFREWEIISEAETDKVCDFLKQSVKIERKLEATTPSFFVMPVVIENCLKGRQMWVNHDATIIVSEEENEKGFALSDGGKLYDYLSIEAKKKFPELYAFASDKGIFDNPEGCAKSGGEWISRTKLSGAGCAFEYPDAGNWCKNRSDCMGNECTKSVLFTFRPVETAARIISLPIGRCVEKTTGNRACRTFVRNNGSSSFGCD